MKPTSVIFLVLTGLAAFAMAGCGGDDDSYGSGPRTNVASSPAAVGSPTGAAAAQSSTGAVGGTLQVKDTGIGKVLASDDGKTLYTFNNDAAGKSNCNGSCASTWPPLTVTAVPTRPEGVAGEFSLINRDDGQKQLALNGKPLYHFAADAAAGDTKGEGVGGVWFAAKAGAASSSTSPVPNPSDNGY